MLWSVGTRLGETRNTGRYRTIFTPPGGNKTTMAVMRLIATADLHYNHARSARLAEELIERINGEQADALLVIGDTATTDGTALEKCLGMFRCRGPRLFVAGNHELWSRDGDSYRLFKEELPRRVRGAGWHWLQDEPFVAGGWAIVGSIGWYDYSFASAGLGIPLRFYEQKVSPGAAAASPAHQWLLEGDDVPEHARHMYARWNDGRFVRLGRGDPAFVEELLGQLQRQLEALRHVPHVLAAIHHLPFTELLPPPNVALWEFARAYLGSSRFGECLRRFPNVRQVLCGHSHYPAEVRIGPIHAINLGAGYRAKYYRVLELPE